MTENLNDHCYDVEITLDNAPGEYRFSYRVTHEELSDHPNVNIERARKAADILMADYERQTARTDA